MAQRKATSSSKFGHLFGDTNDSPSIASKESRLSGKGTGDLYKDPLAALIPPVTATTNTTRGTATPVKATLSPPLPASSQTSPPGSTSSSRSSSRLQHHALFSSLTGDTASGTGSIFDSGSASTLSSAKRDLFGDSGSTSSASRRTTTPPLTKTSSNTVASSSSSSRVPTPPLGGSSSAANTRIQTTALDPDVSPLGQINDSASSRKDEDHGEALSFHSPLTPEPLTRTNSQASTRSHESVRSVKSSLSHEIVDDTRSVTSSTKGTTSRSSAPGTGTVTPTKESQQQQQPQLPPISTSTVRNIPAGRASTSSDRTTATTTTPKPVSTPVQDPILNPLSGPPSSVPSERRTSASSRPSGELAHPQATLSPPVRPSSSASSQSIDTFQSISRTASPMPRPISRSGFERDNDNISPTPSSSTRSKLINVVIPDEGAEAFGNDLFFSAPPAPFMPTMSALRSSSVLDSGSVTSARTQISAASSNSSSGNNNTGIVPILGQPGVGASTVGQPKTRSGFSLGEDVADSSNPWGNSLVDSLDRTTINEKRIDYTQSDDSIGASFLPEAALSLPASSSSTYRHSNNNGASLDSNNRTIVPLPSLDEDIGGFDDLFSGVRSKKNSSSLAGGSRAMGGATDTFSSGLPKWNVADAVEAAALDPGFLGAQPLENPGTAKVLAMMQMPKDKLEKDVSAQEVFDNPWE
ncbi:hypothetical protein BGZ83_007574 [Gryganskiella cystojenkinii]|nr:hypothetical protein BGZ83_007574 [Gryganskiella cystojenkinii]